MTHIHLEDSHGECSLTAVEHADTDEACIAISTLMCSIAEYAEAMQINVFIRLEPGDSCIVWRKNERGRFLLEYASTCCRALQETLPKIFHFTEKVGAES